MKLCLYDSNEVGAVVGDQVYPVGDALVKASHITRDYTMVDIIDKLTATPTAMDCVRDCITTGKSLPLSKVKLLAPINNPPAIWAAAANYSDHQKEMLIKMGGKERVNQSKDDLMAEFFLKPSSSIIGPGEVVVLPKVSKDVDFECELCAVIGKNAKRVTEEEALDYIFGYTICWESANAIHGDEGSIIPGTFERDLTRLPLWDLGSLPGMRSTIPRTCLLR